MSGTQPGRSSSSKREESIALCNEAMHLLFGVFTMVFHERTNYSPGERDCQSA
jgi:hypothetical protein